MKYFIYFLIICVQPIYAQSVEKIARDGNKQYNDSLYVEAEVSYKKSLAKNHSLNKVKFNLANSLFKQSRYDESIDVLNEIINSTADSMLKSDSYYNIGNNFLQQQNLQEAVDSYKNCLRINPEDEQARYNLSKALTLLNNQQNKPNEGQEGENSEEEKQNSGETDGQEEESNEDKNNSDSENNNESDSNSQSPPNTDAKETNQNSYNLQEGEMSQEDMERILQALDREEQLVQEKMKKANLTNKNKNLEKDW